MDATLKYKIVITLMADLFENADRISETSSNTEAKEALFEIKMRIWSELRNLLNACNSEEDIIYLLPEQLRESAERFGYTFTGLGDYVPSDAVRKSQVLAEKVVNSVKEQQILEMLMS